MTLFSLLVAAKINRGHPASVLGILGMALAVHHRERLALEALLFSTWIGWTPLIKLFHWLGADFNKCAKLGYNSDLLSLIQQTKNLKNIALLCDYGLTGIKDNIGDGVIDYAAKTNDLKIVKHFIETKKMAASQAKYALHWAIMNKSLEIVKYLHSKGCSLEIEGPFKQTPIILAIEHGNLDIVKYLAQQDANYTKKKFLGDSLCHIASKYGKLEILKHLASLKALGLNQKNTFKETPLTCAVRSKHMDIVKYLIEKNANYLVKDICGNNLCHIAAENRRRAIYDYLASLGTKGEINTKEKK